MEYNEYKIYYTMNEPFIMEETQTKHGTMIQTYKDRMYTYPDIVDDMYNSNMKCNFNEDENKIVISIQKMDDDLHQQYKIDYDTATLFSDSNIERFYTFDEYINDKYVRLYSNEFEILYYLDTHPGSKVYHVTTNNDSKLIYASNSLCKPENTDKFNCNFGYKCEYEEIDIEYIFNRLTEKLCGGANIDFDRNMVDSFIRHVDGKIYYDENDEYGKRTIYLTNLWLNNPDDDYLVILLIHLQQKNACIRMPNNPCFNNIKDNDYVYQ